MKKSKDRAWKAFSLFIRTRGSVDGINICFTCDTEKPVNEGQAGHFIPGRHGGVLFSEEGVQFQCVGCNIFHRGNLPAYYKKMLQVYGQEVINKLFAESVKIVKYKTADYLEKEKEYQEKLKELN